MVLKCFYCEVPCDSECEISFELVWQTSFLQTETHNELCTYESSQVALAVAVLGSTLPCASWDIVSRKSYCILCLAGIA